jgi:hypothetical protein
MNSYIYFIILSYVVSKCHMYLYEDNIFYFPVRCYSSSVIELCCKCCVNLCYSGIFNL